MPLNHLKQINYKIDLIIKIFQKQIMNFLQVYMKKPVYKKNFKKHEIIRVVDEIKPEFHQNSGNLWTCKNVVTYQILIFMYKCQKGDINLQENSPLSLILIFFLKQILIIMKQCNNNIYNLYIEINLLFFNKLLMKKDGCMKAHC